MDRIRRFHLASNTRSPVYGLGLLTDEPDYRLCWLLNQNFLWNLVRSADFLVPDKSRPISQSYACFENDSDHHPAIRLIANRSKEGLWLTVYRQVDFLLVVSVNEPAPVSLDEIKSSISAKVPQIRALFTVPLPSFCYL